MASKEFQPYDIDSITELSAEEIEKLLAEGAGIQEQSEKDVPQEDVLDLLEDTEDDDLLDIQDMLKKSDRNEAIAADTAERQDSGENPADKLLEDIEGAGEEEAVDAKTRKAQEKARRAQEKMRQKEEKAAKKKAAKEAARAEKEARRKSKTLEDAETVEEEKPRQEEIKEYDLLLDKDLLDSIVSDAGNLGREEERSTPQESGSFSVNELGSDYDAARDREYISRSEGMKVEDVEPAKEETTVESSIMEVDMDEIDALIPDIDNAMQENQEKGKKGGFVTKIISMLTEEEEEPENENLSISEENQGIIRDLDNEDKDGKGKKSKKAKKPAKKPAKKKEKKKKPPKPKKPKKVKEAEPYVPGRKITFRKALPILLLGATVGAVVFIFVHLVTDFSVKQEAAEAYRDGDYATCYQSLYGKSLNDEQAQMLGKSESILYMEQMFHKYELVRKDGTEAEALDSLIQVVDEYPQVYEYAAQWDALQEVGEIYAGILGILSEKYGLTEQQAREIAAIKSNIQYTRVVTAVAEGGNYDSGKVSGAPQMPEQDSEAGTGDAIPETPETQPDEMQEMLPDELPEESELGGESFVDIQ